MRFTSNSLLCLGAFTVPAAAFAPQATVRPPLQLQAQKSNNFESVKNALSGVALATVLWTAPATLAGTASHFHLNNELITSVANAKEMASGTGSRVNKDPESLLRYGLPIDNKEVSIFVFYCDIFLHLYYLNNHHSASTTIHPLSGQRTPKEH
jgi:hypothetical protein